MACVEHLEDSNKGFIFSVFKISFLTTYCGIYYGLMVVCLHLIAAKIKIIILEEEKRKDIGNKTKQKRVSHTILLVRAWDITIAMVKREGRRKDFSSLLRET